MNTVLQEEIMLPELFDALPESVILFKPLFNKSEEVIDFEIAYCNQAASNFLQSTKNEVYGQTVLTSKLVDVNYGISIFKKCKQVWETGKPSEDILHHEKLDRHFSSLKSKINEGVISVTRDKTDHLNAEKEWRQQLLRFTNILDASADGVLILEAIRNEAGEVIDFKLAHCNKIGFVLGQLTPGCINKTLLQIFPHLVHSSQFELHKQVIETGIPARIETTFRNAEGEEYGWFIVSLMKIGDCVVSTFIDDSEKKKNQEKIEEQADLLTTIFEASINGIFALSAVRNEDGHIIDFTVVKINQAFTRIVGITAETAEGNSYQNVFPYGKRLGMFDLYCEVISTGNNLRKELNYSDEIHQRWYDISAVKSGSNGIVITFTDITKSKINKHAIEDGSKYLQDVIDSSQTGILLITPVKDKDGIIINFRFKTVNQTLANFASKPASELVDKLLNEVFKNDINNEIFEKYKAFAESGKSEDRFELKYYIGGAEAWMDILVKKRNEDLLITLLDFTPLKLLQQEIAAAAHKLTTVINTSPAGMFTLQPLWDETGEIEDFRFGIVNQAVASYIGETAEKLTNSLGSIYFPAYKKNGLFNIYKETFLHHQPHSFDFHYEDGYDVYFNIHTVRLGDEVLVTFTDQTILKKLQVQLEASIQELKKSNSGLEEFAYAASHDLQEPLRKINYFSERLRKGIGQKLSEEDNRMFLRMENAAARMSQLINDLLTYSQISRSTRTFGKIDLNEILQQVQTDLETRIADKKAIIRCEKMPVIQGDPLQLSQLFQNLLSNSLKYSKANVSPVISIDCKRVVKQINQAEKTFYEIKIKDNGIGFEQEHAERIFKVFHRLHGQSEYPGTGIGLAIVQKVVENHQGTITATGSIDEGATFTILLPE